MADPTGILINIALQAAIGLIIAALTPKQNNEGPRLDDRQVTTSTYGDEIPIGYGTTILSGNIIWGKDLEEVAETVEIGKGNPFSLGTNTTYYYFATFAVGLARREVESILRIYADGKIIYDVETGDTPSRNSMPGLSFKFYPGNHTQGRDPIIAADVGEDNCPAYRGICYVVFNRMPLENFGNRIPTLRFVVAFKSETGQLASYDWEDMTQRPTFHDSDYDPDRAILYSLNIDDDTGEKYLFAHDAYDGSLILKRDKDDVSSIFSTDQNTRFLKVGAGSPYIVIPRGSTGGGAIAIVDKETLSLIVNTAHEGTFPYQNSNTANNPITGTGYGPYVDPSASYEIIEVLGKQRSSHYLVTLGDGSLLSNPGAGLAILGLSKSGTTFLAGSGTGAYQMGNEYYAGASDGSAICQGPQKLNQTDFFYVLVGDDYVPQNANGPLYLCVGSCGPLVYTSGGYSPNVLITLPAQSAGVGFSYLWYDPATDILIWSHSGGDSPRTRAYFMDSSNGYANIELRWTSNSALFGPLASTRGLAETLENGVIQLYTADTGGDTHLEQRVDIETGETVYQVYHNPNAFPGGQGISWGVDGSAQAFWVPTANRMIDNNFGIFYLDPPASRLGETLDVVVEDIVTRGKLGPTDIDVTELATKTVQGYPIARGVTYRSALEPLMTAYNFFGVEKDGKLVFEFHNNLTNRVIDADDLVRSGQDTVIEEARGQELETPRALYITHRDPEEDDNKMVQGARRISFPHETMGSVGEKSTELPLYLTANEGAEIAERILFDSWVQRESLRFRLPPRYLDVLPNDVLELNAAGRLDSIRATRVSVGANLELEIEGNVVDGEVYTQRIQGISPPGAPNYTRGGNTWQLSETVQGWFLDMPLLQDVDLTGRTNGILYFTAGASASGRGAFPGAALLVSFDGADFNAEAGLATGAPWGILETTMPNMPGIDWNGIQETSINVRMFAREDQMASVTVEDMLRNDANTALIIRADGRVEIIGFRDVQAAGGSLYTLTGLIRGKRGTEINGFSYSSTGLTYFVLVKSAWITGYYEAATRDGAEATYRIVPSTPEAVNVDDETKTLAMQSLMPYRPSHVEMTVAGSDRTISWTRRTRQGGTLLGGTGTVPLAEDSESYEVDILSGPGGSVLRTLTSSTPSVTYTAAQANVDFGTDFPNPLYVKVYQISAQVGRGFTYETALTEAA